jgi:hypothetical protein
LRVGGDYWEETGSVVRCVHSGVRLVERTAHTIDGLLPVDG